MCKSSDEGGKRCATETRKTLRAAERNYAANPGVDEFDALQKARAEHASTPLGKKELLKSLKDDGLGETEKFDVEIALERGVEIAKKYRSIERALKVPRIKKIPKIQKLTLELGKSEIIHTDPELGLTYVWHDMSPDEEDKYPREKAIETSLLEVLDKDQNRIAYLRISFTNDEIMQSTFHRPLAWAEENKGWNIGWQTNKMDERQGKPVEAISEQTIWAKAHRSASISPPSRNTNGAQLASYNVMPEHAPDEATMQKEIAAIEKPLAKEMKTWAKKVESPFVAYSNVNEEDSQGNPLRGTGVGTAMYIIAAKQLGKTGRVLGASGLQSEYAQTLWSRFAKNPKVQTMTTISVNPSTKEKTESLALDYRPKISA